MTEFSDSFSPMGFPLHAGALRRVSGTKVLHGESVRHSETIQIIFKEQEADPPGFCLSKVLRPSFKQPVSRRAFENRCYAGKGQIGWKLAPLKARRSGGLHRYLNGCGLTNKGVR